MKLMLAATFALLAMPAFAQDAAMDANTLMCKDFMTQDATKMAATGMQVKGASMADARITAMADADVTTMTSTACTTHPDNTVMEAVKMSSMTTMTCKDMMAMDDAGMASAGMTMKMAMKDDARITAMADADVTAMAGTACKAHPDGTVMDAMKM